MNAGELLTNTRGVARPGIRRQVTFQYAYKGQPICREMFLFLHGISRTRLFNLVKHFCTNGVVLCTHGNKGILPKHAMKFDEITQVVDFIKRYADIHAVLLPGRLPKHHDYHVMKLPPDVSKAIVYTVIMLLHLRPFKIQGKYVSSCIVSCVVSGKNWFLL